VRFRAELQSSPNAHPSFLVPSFNPCRWLDPNPKNHPSLLTFGHGPHTCVGMALYIYEAKTVGSPCMCHIDPVCRPCLLHSGACAETQRGVLEPGSWHCWMPSLVHVRSPPPVSSVFTAAETPLHLSYTSWRRPAAQVLRSMLHLVPTYLTTCTDGVPDQQRHPCECRGWHLK
jgi:hypothetical protein